MSNIDIDLQVQGVQQAIADLRAVAAELDKAGQAARALNGANMQIQAILTLNVTTLTVHANTVIFSGAMPQTTNNNQQNNTFSQTNNTVNKFGSGLNSARWIVLAAAAAVVEMTKAVVEANTALMNIGIVSGGSQSQSAQLNSIGRAAGVSDIGGLSRQFMAKISSDSMAAAFANRQGIHAYGPMDPNLNAAEKLLRATEYILTANKHDATQFARIEGLEDLLKLRGLSEKSQTNLLVGDPMRQHEVMNEATQKDMLEFQYGLVRVGSALLNVATPLLDMVLTTYHVVDNLNKLADWLGEASYNLARFSEDVRALVRLESGENHATVMADFVAAIVELETQENERKQAMKDHSKAMKDHADALEYATRNGIYGGGDRARGAVPSKWMGVNASRYVGDAARLGAFNL